MSMIDYYLLEAVREFVCLPKTAAVLCESVSMCPFWLQLVK